MGLIKNIFRPGLFDEGLSTRFDGWQNLLKGFGFSAQDGLAAQAFTAGHEFRREGLEQMYRFHGVVAAIVDVPALDATREAPSLIEDPDESNEGMRIFEVEQALRDLPVGEDQTDFLFAIREALRWARLYGLGVIVLGIDDGQPSHLPVNEDMIREVRFARVHHRYEVYPASWVTDLSSERYGEPETYQITGTTTTGYGTSTYIVHASRVILVRGIKIRTTAAIRDDPWPLDSVLVRVRDKVRNADTVENGGARTVTEKNIGLLRIKGLAGKIGSASGEAELTGRIKIIQRCKSILHTVLVDAEESFEFKDASLSGIAEMMDRYPILVAAAARMPVTKLYGRSAAGMNATGEGDDANYRAMLKGEIVQPLVIPAYRRVARLVMLSRSGPTSGKVPGRWVVLGGALDEPTAKQLAEGRKIKADTGLVKAQTDGIYLDRSVVTPDEVAASRFGGGLGDIDISTIARRAVDTSDAPVIDIRSDDETGDATKVGLFFRLPEVIAAQRGSLEGDSSPPHVTFLNVGDVSGREEEFIEIVTAFGKTITPRRASLAESDVLINGKGDAVQYQHVGFNNSWGLETSRSKLVGALRARDFLIVDISPERWLAHLTLEYGDGPNATFVNEPLVGTWVASELEVWGLDEVVTIPLGSTATFDTKEP